MASIIEGIEESCDGNLMLVFISLTAPPFYHLAFITITYPFIGEGFITSFITNLCRAKGNNTYQIVYKGASGVAMDGGAAR